MIIILEGHRENMLARSLQDIDAHLCIKNPLPPFATVKTQKYKV